MSIRPLSVLSSRTDLNGYDALIKRPIASALVKAAEIPALLFTSETLKDYVGWSSRPNLSVEEEHRLLRLWNISQSRESTFREDDIDWHQYRMTGTIEVFSEKEVSLIHEAANCVTGEEPSGNIRCLSSLNEPLYNRFMRFYESRNPVHMTYEFDIGPSRHYHHAMYLGDLDENGLVIEVANFNFHGKVKGFIAPSTLLNFFSRAASNKSGLYAIRYNKTISMDLARKRSISALGKFKYNAASSNCENFASWVMTNNDTNEFCSRVRRSVDQMRGGQNKFFSANRH